MSHLKKLLDKTPKQVYNISKKDGEGFDLSSIPLQEGTSFRPAASEPFVRTLWDNYKIIKDQWDKDPSLFPNPPVFSGGFFRDIVWGRNWPADLDLFFNSHGMTKEEAEDNLCLFLVQAGLRFTEQDNARYAGKSGLNSFRVFNCETNRAEHRCHLQVILKDLGPPEDDPLYVTNDFHYNHSRAALSVVGDPEIHYHGHAVAGWEHRMHVQYREGGMNKCRNIFYGYRNFKMVNLALSTYNAKGKPKSDLKMPNPCAEVKLTEGPAYLGRWNNLYGAAEPVAVDPLNVLQARNVVIQQRNEFVNQFDPLRNNRRPLP